MNTTLHPRDPGLEYEAPKEPVEVFPRRTPYISSLSVCFSLLSVVIYGCLFVVLFYMLKSGKISPICAIIPVVVVGWFFGLIPGIVAAVLSFPLNIMMCNVVGLDWWQLMMADGSGIAGTLGLVLVSAIVGRLSDLTVQSKKDRDSLNEANQKLLREIVGHQRTAAEMKETRAELNHLVDASQDPILMADRNSSITKANKAFLKMIGFPESGVLGGKVDRFVVSTPGRYRSTTGELVSIGDKFLEGHRKKTEQLFEEGRISNWTSYYMNRQGRVVPVIQSVVLLYNDEGERTASFGIIRDVTEQRTVELELIRSKDAAESASKSKSSFLANMSHEIRTPMNGIIGFTEMLLETNLSSEQEEYSRIIKQSGESLLTLLNDILDFSKIEAGKIDFESIDFDVEVLAYDICDLMHPRAAGRDVELVCRIGDQLPARLVGDPHRFRQVLVNLLGNAVKFTESGKIEISLEVEKEQAGRVMLRTTVRDTGIGIPEDMLETIFDLFQQADESITRKHGGTGLGLSICRRIARQMGGDVWAESVPGQGSTFHYTCWMRQSSDREAHRVLPVTLAGKKILITDDSTANLEILTSHLRAAGMRPYGFMSSSEALKALQDALENKDPFHFCILDIRMPDMSGYRLAKIIRALAGGDIPLLAFSSTTEGAAKSCERAGFNGFLPKPINRVKLFKMMARLLSDAGGMTGQPESKAELVTQQSMFEDAKHAILILLAEDNPVNQKLTALLLTKAGYRVDVAGNGREAVSVFTAHPERYDIIFMDIQMPELNGLEATRLLRQKGFDDVPIIAMTANVMKGDRERCLVAGMNDYLPKPIRREAVFKILRKWVMEKVHPPQKVIRIQPQIKHHLL